MTVLSVTGETPSVALKKAQEQYGDTIMIISTKEIKRKTISESGLYELIFTLEESEKKESDKSSKKSNSIKENLERINTQKEKKRALNPYAKVDDVSLQLSEAVKQISKIANSQERPSQNLNQNLNIETSRRGENEYEEREEIEEIEQQKRAVHHKRERSFQKEERESRDAKIKEIKDRAPKSEDPKELVVIRREIDKLNDKLKLIQNMFWEEKSPKNGNGFVIPSEFSEIYRITRSSGMSKEHLDSIMQLTLQLMPVKMRENSILIKRYFSEVLRKMIYSRAEMELLNGKKIVMLVGPTGVGKTTTLAKLAARYSRIMDVNYKVGIITLDTYRIGAYEQLMFYARKMRLSIEKVVDPPEFLSAIRSLSHCDYILIDTAGSSHNDKKKIDTLKSFLNSEIHSSIDVSLVISATTKYQDLRDIYQTFSILDIDTLIVTKLDETNTFGNIFSLVYDTKRPISYLSTGQEVPNDLMCAKSEYLVECLLDGFNRGRR